MSRICAVTGRRPVKGKIIHRKGQSKKSGGIGTHVTTLTTRLFRPNLQWIKVKLQVRAEQTGGQGGDVGADTTALLGLTLAVDNLALDGTSAGDCANS